MKKVNLSHYRGQYLFLYFGMPILFGIITLIAASVEIGFADAVFIALMSFAISVVGFGTCFAVGYKLLVQIQINSGDITSYLFKIRLCTVNTDKEVFYILYRAKEDRTAPTSRYVLLSNGPIPKRKKNEIFALMGYKPKKCVLLHYDSDTMQHLDLQNWTCCEMKL